VEILIQGRVVGNFRGVSGEKTGWLISGDIKKRRGFGNFGNVERRNEK